MNFFEAYEILQTGKFVARESWEGEFLWIKPAAKVKSEWCKDPILKMLADGNGGTVECEMLICRYSMKDRKVYSGYLPTQEDLAASDWIKITAGVDREGLFIKKPMTSKKPRYKEGDLFDGVDEVIKKPTA